MQPLFLLGLGCGFLVAVVFMLLVEGAHIQAECSRRVLIARKRAARA